MRCRATAPARSSTARSPCSSSADGRVIACSDDHFRPGDRLSIDAAFLSLAPGAGHSGVTVLGDTYYAVGGERVIGLSRVQGRGATAIATT